MGVFDNIQSNIPKVSALSKVSMTEIDALKTRYPGLPVDYLAFLHEVGFGNLGEIQLYSGPINAESVYTPAPENLRTVLLIGDDMQGYCFGFDTSNQFRLIEINPQGAIEFGVESDFTGLLHNYLTDD